MVGWSFPHSLRRTNKIGSEIISVVMHHDMQFGSRESAPLPLQFLGEYVLSIGAQPYRW